MKNKKLLEYFNTQILPILNEIELSDEMEKHIKEEHEKLFGHDVGFKRIYFANALFTEAERDFNNKVVTELRNKLSNHKNPAIIYLPQENPEINDKSGYADSKAIFNGDNEHLDVSDLMIAVMDGTVPDVGVAAEVGRAAAMGIPIIGLFTDVRQGSHGNKMKIEAIDNDIAESQFPYVNLYFVGAIKDNGLIVTSTEDLIKEVEKFLSK